MKRLVLLTTTSWACLLGAGCSEDACTLIGCENEAVVTFPSGAVSGPYDLVIAREGDMLTARCNDPNAAEAAANPPELDCNASGFELRGHALANARSVQITIIDTATDQEVAANVEVFLDVVDESQPNGPDCPPTCFVRNGRLVLSPGETS
jgi:hypothetical protein